MKKILFSIVTITTLIFSSKAQNVNIPDANFKSYLVGNTAINTSGDSEIQVTEANSFTGTIDINSNGTITNLTGIEEFVNLTNLDCAGNNITIIDLTQNIDLTFLNISAMSTLSSIDISQNTALVTFYCGGSSLNSLDLSSNTNLTTFDCNTSSLTSINIANGNNTNISYFKTLSNPNLNCIEVDNVGWSSSNWTDIDSWSYFSVDCSVPNAADTVYVNTNATGNNDGTSWTDAYTELSDATINANQLSEIWVAEGTYLPHATNRFVSFIPIAKMYGGFNGTETQLTERDWIANPTILSGNIGDNSDETDNSYTVIIPQSMDSIVVDGFTISDGYANGSTGALRFGGGMYVSNNTTPVTIKNCIIKNNKATGDAGIYCELSGANTGLTKNVLIENTQFTNNLSRWSPAFGIIVLSGTINVNLVNCLIDNNETNFFPSSTNTANNMPGGRFTVVNGSGLNGKVINCTFTKNTNNSAFTDAEKSVFGIQGSTNNTQIYNSIFWDNPGNLDNISVGYGNNATYTPNSVEVFNTISEDVMANIPYVTTTNSGQGDPLFTNSSVDDFTLQNTSVVIDGGSTDGILSLIPITDLNRGTRIVGTNIDLGCYESCTATNDLTTLTSGLTITANENSTGITYRWLDCDNNDSFISGETSQSFTATSNGSYACEITNECSIDTTLCIDISGLGITDNNTSSNLLIYPNPTNGELNIETGTLTIAEAKIVDITGKTIATISFDSNTADVSYLANGIYFLQIQTENGLVTQKIIKE